MRTLKEILSRKFMKYEIPRQFTLFGSCDLCNKQNQTSRYREYDKEGMYKEGLTCIECYNKIHEEGMDGEET